MARLPETVREAVRRYRSALDEIFPGRVHRLVVFGSFARGEATEDSDVDVLVVMDRLDFPERRRALDLAAEIGLDEGLVLGPLVLSRAEWDELDRRERLLPREITRDGIDA